jgi:UDP-N-acetylmuramoyl-L-alanyl-D-glutamate--2,6-diaminopimelate ligase
MLNRLLRAIERIIPKKLYRLGQPVYHYLLALTAALIYRFPSRHINIVAVTGTKGKSTTVELTTAILEAAGYSVASLSTVQFKIGKNVRPNLFKMTVPGRFFVQKFLREAVNAGCHYVVLEMSSQAALQFRHKHIDFDALIYTNLAPEHIESHGSFENYRDTKLGIARAVVASSKPDPIIVANADDAEGEKFLAVGGARGIPYRLKDGEPFTTTTEGSTFVFREHVIHLHISGVFNIMNALGAATFAEAHHIPIEAIVSGLESVQSVRGRVEYIKEGQGFNVVVDYAHTPESLESFYEIFRGHHNICVLGNTGGGRDTWKRSVMAGIAEKHCNEIILTNEDPYDEDPRAIIAQMEEGVIDKQRLSIIIDRREAIREAFARAERRVEQKDPNTENISVLITGKGTDPYIMSAEGSKMEWDDARVAREELATIKSEHA